MSLQKKLKFFFIIFLSFLFLGWGITILQENLENYFFAQISQPFQQMAFVKIPEKPKLEIEAESAIAIRINQAGEEKIFFKKNIDQSLPIASLTKLMTALIVIENYDLKKIITISKEAANQKNVPHYGNLDKEVGKEFTVEQLLDLILIYSSNDASWALAEVMGVENFVKKMNEKARELGLENTHFVNPHGLDPEIKFDKKKESRGEERKKTDLEDLYFEGSLENFNYSTAKDLVKISQYILKNHPLIFEITRKEPFYSIENGVFDIVLREKMIGGKTGYTEKAKGNLLLIFENQKGSIFINIILRARSTEARIREMQKLLDWLGVGYKNIGFKNDNYKYPGELITPFPEVSAKSYLIADLNNSFILAEKNPTKKFPIASLTKLMTALVIAENIDLKKSILVIPEMIEPFKSWSWFKPKLEIGKEYQALELFYPLLTESSNDVAEALSYFLGKEKTIQLMNEKAKTIGMRNTKFVEPSGLDKENISTAEDLFYLGRYILNTSPLILKITKEEKSPLLSFDSLRNKNILYNNPNFIGGKTGYFEKNSGLFLLEFTTKDNQSRDIVIILLDSDNLQKDLFQIFKWLKENYFIIKDFKTLEEAISPPFS